MAWLAFLGPRSSSLRLEGPRIYLRPPQMEDFVAWSHLRAASRAFLEPWEPTWPEHELTLGAFRLRLRRQARERAKEEAFSFLLFRRNDDQLLGGLTLGQIHRGVVQSGTVGYWMGQVFAGKGYMSEALRMACRYAFSDLKLHRLEASCLPTNHRSIALLERAGFRREGLGRAFLQIAGRWQDHYFYSLLESDGIAGDEILGN